MSRSTDHPDFQLLSLYVSAGAPCLSPAAGETLKKSCNYTIFTVYLRNNVNGHKSVVQRRYSDFFTLRKRLIELVSWGHCEHCQMYKERIASYPFPRRRAFGSSKPAIVQERADALEMFIRYLLHSILNKTFNECDQAKSSIRSCFIQSFLEADLSIDVTTKSKAKADMIENPVERKESISNGTKCSNGISATSSGIEVERSTSVGADTCHICFQKWTDCYCVVG